MGAVHPGEGRQPRMPPWFIDRNVGVRKFKNDPSLTEDEIGIITSWVDHGAQQGNPPTCHRQSTGLTDRWSIKPNLIVI